MADDPKPDPDIPAQATRPTPSREEILALLSSITDPEAPPDALRSRIVIKPDGQVLIENLSLDLMELALLLDPDAQVTCDLPQTPGEPQEG